MNIPSLRSRKRARIEIIPLIDVVFFLLATFMMVSLSMVKNNGIKVNLPAAATSAPQEHNDRTTISVTKDGDLRTLPCQLPDADSRFSGLDGFYAARMIKN